MKILFDQVMPFPLSSMNHEPISLCGREEVISPSEYVLIKAVSGRGKSTLTGIISGTRKDFTGKVYFDGKDISLFGMKEWQLFRRDFVSVVYQDLQLFSRISVIENLMLKFTLNSTVLLDELEDWLSIVGLQDKRNAICGTLSMGQQQRVAILRALIQPFKCLLMDEPFSHLDEDNRLICSSLIHNQLKKNNAGMIVTSLDGIVELESHRMIQI